MNPGPGEPPAAAFPGRWPSRKLVWLIALAWVIHVSFIFVLGTRKAPRPRQLGPIPHLQLAPAGDEIIALTDPTLFSLPQASDFTTAYWSRTPEIRPPAFHWPEPEQFLPLPGDSLGAPFREFMAGSQRTEAPLNFKLEAELSSISGPPIAPLARATEPQFSGPLAARRWLNPGELPALAVNDVIAPGKVQALVDATGNVTSAVLLESSGLTDADQRALQLTLKMRFTPAAQFTLGEITFNWQTVPITTPQAP